MIDAAGLKPFLIHADSDVRDAVAAYFSDSWSQDEDVLLLVLDAFERYGPPATRHMLAVAPRLPVNQESLDRLLTSLAACGDPGAILDLNAILRHAPVPLFEANDGAIREAAGVRPETIDRLERRRGLAAESGADLWRMLREFSDRNRGARYVGDIDHDHADDLVEAVGRCDVPDTREVCSLLSSPEVEGEWLEVFLADLAGVRRMPEAVPHLVSKFHIDTDYLLERASEALARIGDPAAARLVRAEFPGSTWSFRLYASGMLKALNHEETESVVLDLLEVEDDSTIRTELCHALCRLFSRKGIDVVLREIAAGYDRLMASLEEDLLVVADVLGVDLPEEARWRAERAEERLRQAERRSELEDMGRGYGALRDRWLDSSPSTGDGGEPELRRGRDFAPGQGFADDEPIVRRSPRIGRNDPCPCGSGRKYKKCCGRQQPAGAARPSDRGPEPVPASPETPAVSPEAAMPAGDPRTVDIAVERLKRLPKRAGETWEGGTYLFPGWVMDETGEPYRPRLTLWASRSTRLAHAGGLHGPWDEGFAGALEALVDFASDERLAGYRPDRIAVNSPALARYLAEKLSGAGVRVEPAGETPIVEDFLDHLTRQAIAEDPRPGLLTGRGVQVNRIRAFAEAACRFYQAGPWNELTDEDLIEISVAKPIAAMRYAVVMGCGGQVYGLAFYRSAKQYWRSRSAMSRGDSPGDVRSGLSAVTFDSPADLALVDAQLWEDHGLPVAGPDAYPNPMAFTRDGEIRRPDARAMSYQEGLFRALAETTAAELDAGRWEKTVRTIDGDVTYGLSLPFVLDPPDRMESDGPGVIPDRRAMERGLAQVERFLAEQDTDDIDELNRRLAERFEGRGMDANALPTNTPEEEAQDLCYQAFDAFGRRRTILARKALHIFPDCADAYVILAENAGDKGKVRELYRQGVAAGRRALGERVFEEEAGAFWGIQRTRPYMRALFGLGQCLEYGGEKEEAVESYRELLRLNPNDNQGVRYSLLPLLIELGSDEAASELLEEYGAGQSAIWLYSKALLAFRAHGDGAGSRKALRDALRAHEYVPDYLIMAPEETPPLPDSYSPGHETEAVICADRCRASWEATPGALRWLEEQTEE